MDLINFLCTHGLSFQMLSMYSMFLGALPMVRASVYCLPYFLQWLIVIGYAGGSILGLVKVNNSFNSNLVQITYL